MNLPNPIQPGIYPDVEDAEYRKAPGVSVTVLKQMAHSAAHFKEALDHPTPPTPAMAFGTICHHLLLTPRAPLTWAVKPEDFDGRTKEGKAWAAANKDKRVITADEWTAIQGAVEAARNHPVIGLALEGAALELSAFANFDTEHGPILRKGRIDIAPDGPALADLKFVLDATREGFARLMGDAKYYMQAAYYLDLFNDAHGDTKDKFVFLAVEKSPPFAVNCLELHPDDIRRGRAEYQRYLSMLARAQGVKDWTAYHPGSAYSQAIRTVTLPTYTRKQLDETILP